MESLELERDASDRQAVHFRVVCSKGTYVRSLAHDLGAALGTAAHLTALRREAIGEYRVQDAWQIEDLAEQLWAQGRARRAGQQPAADQRGLQEQQEQQQEGGAAAGGEGQ